ncbi:MAG: helix-turn-helix domain-containing protein [Desulfomonilaceae bacterium]|nr:helix-turn-helix domain-containing protein [Desulfomonilaceae bacterium]
MMNDESFSRLLEGVKQGAEYLKGLRSPSGVRKVTVRVPDIKNIREKLNVSQAEFARMIGISVRTLQNWEQNRRVPDKPSRILLELAATYPKQVQKVARKVAEQEAVIPEAAEG